MDEIEKKLYYILRNIEKLTKQVERQEEFETSILNEIENIKPLLDFEKQFENSREKVLKAKQIEEDANIFLNSMDAEKIYEYALNDKTADIIECVNKIIEINNAKYMYLCAKNLEGVNVYKLFNAIIKTNDARYLYLFARDIPNLTQKQMLELSKAVINTNNQSCAYDFLLIDTEKLKYCDIEGLKKIILADEYHTIILFKVRPYLFNEKEILLVEKYLLKDIRSLLEIIDSYSAFCLNREFYCDFISNNLDEIKNWDKSDALSIGILTRSFNYIDEIKNISEEFKEFVEENFESKRKALNKKRGNYDKERFTFEYSMKKN